MKTNILENRVGALIKSTANTIKDLISKDIVGKNISFRNNTARSPEESMISGKCTGVDCVHINGNNPKNIIVYIFVDVGSLFIGLYQTNLSSIEIL